MLGIIRDQEQVSVIICGALGCGGYTKGLSDSIITNCYYRAGSSVNMSFVDDHDCDNCNEIAGVGQRPEWYTDLSSTNIAVRHTSSKFDYVELEYVIWTLLRS